jgi:putative nucleotidyltransferase with HDIG domain
VNIGEPASQRRVLFVDDDEQVLDGIRDLLRRQRRTWNMTFALGGPAGLEAVRRQPFDIVISDMRMPGLSGAALLEQVRQLQPRATRVVLSGYAERDALLEALPVAHQFLAKPCEADELRAVINRGTYLQQVLEDEAACALAKALDGITDAPRSFRRLTNLCADRGADLDAVCGIVASSSALAACVREVAAYFAPKGDSLQAAIVAVGFPLLCTLPVIAPLLDGLRRRPVHGFSPQKQLRHALLVARVAQRVARDPRAADMAFAAAFLHDVGKLAFAVAMPEAYAFAIESSSRSGEPIDERACFGITHAALGAYLLAFFGMPLSVVEAVGEHHELGDIESCCDVARAVRVADALDRERSVDGAPPADVARWRAILDSERAALPTRAQMKGR